MANKTVATNIGVDITPPNNWVTDTYYSVNTDTYFANSLYECLVAHISGVFATDLAAGKWQSKGYGPAASPTFASVTISDGGSLQTGLADDDLVYLKAVDNDTNTLTTVAELHGASTPTFDILAGRLTGTFNPNGQTITGYVIGTNIQAYDAGLTSIAGLITGVNTMIYTTAADTYSTITFTNLPTPSTIVSRDGAGNSSFVNITASSLEIADEGVIKTGTADDDYILFKAVDNDTGDLTEVARLTGASTPTFDILAGRLTGTFNPNGQTITGYVIGTNIQAYHLNLASLAGLAYVSESYVKMTGANTFVLEAEADTRINLINDAGTGTGDIWSASKTQTQINLAVVGLYEHKGGYNAATNTPDLDTTPSGIKKADCYTVSAAGTFFTELVEIGDVLIADQDDPTALAHWTRVNKNIDTATETSPGIAEIATQAEVDTGTDTARYVTPDTLEGTRGVSIQAYDAGLASLAGLTYVSDGFIKCTADNVYSLRTLSDVKTDLALNNVENTALSTWAGTVNIVTVGALTANGNMIFPDPGTNINSYSISLIADNSGTPQTGTIQVIYGVDPYFRFAPPNGAGAATPAVDIHSGSMVLADEFAITTNTSASDLVYFKAVDNDTGTLTEVARLTGASIPTFDILAGRLTGTFNPNGQTITGYVIGTNIQAQDAGLQSISGLATIANSMLYTTALDTYALIVPANSSVLISSVAGVPSWSQTLPTAVQDNITQLGTVQAGNVDAIAGGNIPRWYSYPVISGDFTAAETSEKITITTLNPGTIIHECFIYHIVSFTGGAISAYNLSVGLTATPDKYHADYNVYQAASSTTISPFGSGPWVEDMMNPIDLTVEAECVGDILSNAETGTAVIYLLISCPTSPL